MLTNDAATIARIMAKSSNVVVDTTRMSIKPNWKLQRNTLILRDIPSDAPTDEVKQVTFTPAPSTQISTSNLSWKLINLIVDFWREVRFI